MAAACAGAWGIGPGGLFTEAELAAADQLVQLSGSGGGGGGDEAASESSSPRSVNTCTGAAAWEEAEAEVAGLRLGMELLDRRTRKRYRLLSELYAATSPVAGADAGNSRKRKRIHEPDADVDAGMMMRYGDQCF